MVSSAEGENAGIGVGGRHGSFLAGKKKNPFEIIILKAYLHFHCCCSTVYLDKI